MIPCVVVESIINCLNISSDPATFIQGAFPEILGKQRGFLLKHYHHT
ncbi:hypothetical protein CK203_112319 [Vitis vinifera]|uniref:Uncharacterized protein n=1 Tax=Vitis vinifera TaxID=29760 RepID=A0A438CBU1_VITVI|nr:hypothetical protein CK203_112319 [Vitis vinifera]